MLAFNLCKIPEYMLCELFCVWLLITDISVLDVTLCSHAHTREYLLGIISKSSIHRPLNSCDVSFTSCYWSWLVQRRFFVKQLNVEYKELLNFCFVLDNCNPSTIKIINQNTIRRTMTENNDMNFDILNRVENISFGSKYPSNDNIIIEMELKACNNLYLICTNLKSVSFDEFNICDNSLSSLLQSNSHYLTQITLIGCYDITGMNVLPSLLTNVIELNIYDCKSLNEDGWQLMSIGLKNLTRLTFYSFSVRMLRNTISSFIHLSYLEFRFAGGHSEWEEDDEEEEELDFSGIIFPENLAYLRVSFGDISMNELHLKALFSNNLHNLKELAINGGRDLDNIFNSVPALPQSLTSLD
eukprot:gene16029-21755_t